jgi:dTDP-glucose 4,6-dehydratase
VRLLVTGGAGFIGSNFSRFWKREHPTDRLVVYDALTYAGNRASLADLEASGSVVFEEGDIADQRRVEEVLRAYGIDAVVNFAAESHNSLAVLDPARFFKTNVLGTQALCEAARRVGVARFHHISTCEVYGDLPLESDETFDEESPYRPRTPYNASKAAADHVVRCYAETFSLPVTISNCCNNYGPYQFPEKLIPLFVTRALRREPLPLYRSSSNRREWLHVEDHCRAVEAVLLTGRTGESYNVGSGREASIEEVADAVLAATDSPASLKTIVPDRPGHDRRYLLNSTKIRRELGFEPLVDFEEGLLSTVHWYRDNPSWWEPLVSRSPVEEGEWRAAEAAAVADA